MICGVPVGEIALVALRSSLPTGGGLNNVSPSSCELCLCCIGECQDRIPGSRLLVNLQWERVTSHAAALACSQCRYC